jgi:hypothetical protein
MALISFTGCAHRQVIPLDRQAETITRISNTKESHRLTLTNREQNQIIGRDIALFGDTVIVYNHTSDRAGQMLTCDLQSIKRKSRSIGIHDGIIFGGLSLTCLSLAAWLSTPFAEGPDGEYKLKMLFPTMVISGLAGCIMGGTVGLIIGGQETYIFSEDNKE